MINKALFNTYYLTGQQFYTRKNYLDAERYYEKALIYNDKHAKCHFKLGMIFFKQKKWEEASIWIDKALKLNNNTKWKNQLIQTQRHLGKDIKSSSNIVAENKIRELLIKYPKKSNLYYDLSKLLHKQGKWWQELDTLKKAIDLDNSNAEWHYALGLAEERMNRFEEASSSLQKAIELKKSKIDASWYYRLGYNLEKSNQSKVHIQNAYNTAIKNDKKLNSKRHGIGVFHQQRGLWSEASKEYENLILKVSVNDDLTYDDELYYKLALSYDRQYDWENAKKYYIKTLLINKNRAYTTYRLGFINERLENYEEAIVAYKEAINISKSIKTDWIYRKAYCLSKIGKFEKAGSIYKLYFDFNSLYFTSKVNPFIDSISKESMTNTSFDNISDIFIIANSCFINKDFKNASKYFMEYTKRSNEHNPEICWKLGISLYKLKHYEEASKAFSEMKIFKKAYETPTEPLKNKSFKNAAIFTEYYENSQIKDKTILYESFHGASMSCNPYAIFINLIQRDEFKDWTHIWVINDLDKIDNKYQKIPNVYFISRQSYQYIKSLATVEYLINNVSFPEYYSRREGQKYINTWHGTPIKFLGKDIKDEFLAHRNVARNFLHTTHILNSNKYTMDILLQKYDIENIYNGKRIVSGYPRVDLTLNIEDEEKNRLRKELNILDEETLILYAPTWRGLHGDAKFDVDQLKIDLEAMKSTGHKIMFKGHHMIEKLITDLDLDILLAPNNIDTNILLSIVDMLITDYSSIAFDFMPCNKPILYYAYDIDLYKEERGLYLPLEELPGLVCYKQNELVEKITETLKTNHDDKNDLALENFCSYDKGNTTDNVIDAIFKNDYSKVKVYEKNKKHHLLVFAGPFIPNGITSSIINLVNNIDYSKYSISIVVDPKSIENFDERIEQIMRLPKDVSILGIIGSPNLTIEDKWISDKFMSLNNLQSEEMWDIFYEFNSKDYNRLFGTNTFDTIVNFDGYSPAWAQRFISKSINNVMYLHNNLYEEWKQRFPYLEKTFRTYKYYDKLISVSEKTGELNQNNLSDLFELDKNKFDFSDNLQNPKEIFNKMSKTLENQGDEELFKEGGPVFITMGRLSIEKDQTKLINAFSKIVEINKQAKLLILGEGPLKNDLLQLVKSLNLESNVYLLGRKSNPFPYLKRSDCFVLSSNHEGQPMVLLEALIMGKPVIATDIVGNRSVLENRPGLLVENSEKGLIEGMSKFIESKLKGGEFDIDTYQKDAIEMFYKKVCGVTKND